MKKVFLSIVAAIALGGTAMAGGDIIPVAPTESWSGFYVGVQAGGIWGNADVDYDDTGDPYWTHDMSVDGYSIGVYAGYNWLLENNWLVGIEGEWSHVSADDTGNLMNAGGYIGWKTKVEQNWDASLRLRVGKAVDESLFYVTGGVAWGDFDLNAYEAVNPSHHYSGSFRLTGWTLGAGWEYAFNENLHLRLQYRYTDYGDDTKRIAENSLGYYLDATLDYNAHMVTVGFSYRF